MAQLVRPLARRFAAVPVFAPSVGLAWAAAVLAFVAAMIAQVGVLRQSDAMGVERDADLTLDVLSLTPKSVFGLEVEGEMKTVAVLASR